MPFIIEVKNRESGEAVIKMREGKKLNYEKRKSYKFNIFAFDCAEYAKKSSRSEQMHKNYTFKTKPFIFFLLFT